MPIPGISVMAAVTGAGAASNSITVGDTYSSASVNSNTFPARLFNFNRTVGAGQSEIFVSACCDNDSEDTSWTFGSISGWTTQIQNGNTINSSLGGSQSGGGAIWTRTAPSTESSATVTFSISGFGSSNMDAYCAVMLSANGVLTVLDTTTVTDGNSVSLSPVGDFIIIALSHRDSVAVGVTGGGDVNVLSSVNLGSNEKSTIIIDYAPTTGSYTFDDDCTGVAASFSF